MASAFGAPVGGLLFSMEEVSSFWNQKLSWQIFFCAMVSTFTTDLFNSAFTGFVYQGQFGLFKPDKYILFQVSTLCLSPWTHVAQLFECAHCYICGWKFGPLMLRVISQTGVERNISEYTRVYPRRLVGSNRRHSGRCVHVHQSQGRALQKTRSGPNQQRPAAGSRPHDGTYSHYGASDRFDILYRDAPACHRKGSSPSVVFILQILVATVSVFLPSGFPCSKYFCIKGAADNTDVRYDTSRFQTRGENSVAPCRLSARKHRCSVLCCSYDCLAGTDNPLHVEDTVEIYTCAQGVIVQEPNFTFTNNTYNQSECRNYRGISYRHVFLVSECSQ